MRPFLYSLCTAVLLFSCKKEDPIQPIPTNKAPVARAGQDATIYIPETSFILDGKDSFDPDKDYMEFSWRQIGGPQLQFFQINQHQTTASLTVRGEGQYEFELTVTDPSGLSGRDTVILTVVDDFAIGKTPVLTLFCDSHMLPSNVSGIELGLNAYIENDQNQRLEIISGFSTRQILGPSAAFIQEAYLDFDQIVIPINNLIKGAYQFQIQVTRKGITVYDTATIQVVEDTLQGKEFIFESEWTVDGFNAVSAKTPENQALFYITQYREPEVMILFEDDPSWYEAIPRWNMDSWLLYSINACNSSIEVIINDDLGSYVIGQKVKIRIRYL